MARERRYTGQPSNSAAAIITASKPETIAAATVSNPTGGAVTLTLWIVPSGGSASDANILYDEHSVATTTEPVGLSGLVGQTLNSGDALHAVASAATSLTLHISVDR